MMAHQRGPFALNVSACLLLALASGCASQRAKAPTVKIVGASDFAVSAGDGAIGKPNAQPTSATTEEKSKEVPATPQDQKNAQAEPRRGLVLAQSGEAAASERSLGAGEMQVQAVPGLAAQVEDPSAPRTQLSAIRQGAWVDEVVGNINGKPVYASVFLITGSSTVTALGQRLQRQSELMGREEWMTFAAREISRAVNSFVEDELLRAEAIGSLKPEEKQGLLAFIDRAQRELERQSGGSRAATERRLMEEKGMTLDEWRRQREDTELIRYELGNRIFQRINVSRRDIAQRYQQLSAEYNKPPLATYRLIQVSKGSSADIATITQLLSTQGFEAAAKSKANLNKPAEGGLEPRELPRPVEPAPLLVQQAEAIEPKSQAEAKPDPKAENKLPQLFNNPKLNEAANALKVGETAGPIELTASVAWIRLDSIEDRTVSLYDAQLSIEELIRTQRVERERGRFVKKLSGRASDETVRDIVVRLLEIATERYYPVGKPEPKKR
jgi:hypothetical protein